MVADRQELEDNNDLVQNICKENESVVASQVRVLFNQVCAEDRWC